MLGQLSQQEKRFQSVMRSRRWGCAFAWNVRLESRSGKPANRKLNRGRLNTVKILILPLDTQIRCRVAFSERARLGHWKTGLG